MLSLAQSIVFGLLQGVTELFPISSLGHSVILPSFLGWHINQRDLAFVTFIVATHLATSLVLFAYFYDDWFRIIAGILRSLRTRIIAADDTFARVGWLIVVSSVPVGILGILFEKQFSRLFSAPLYAGLFLIGNGILLEGVELFIRRSHNAAHSYERMAQMSWMDAIKIGLMQCLALLPGFSRTGASLAGGLWAGLSHEDAAHFAFLLATPVIFAAAVLKIPELTLSGESVALAPFSAGAASAAVGAYLSVRFLTRYFKTNTLTPFAWYCIAIGAGAVLLNL